MCYIRCRDIFWLDIRQLYLARFWVFAPWQTAWNSVHVLSSVYMPNHLSLIQPCLCSRELNKLAVRKVMKTSLSGVSETQRASSVCWSSAGWMRMDRITFRDILQPHRETHVQQIKSVFCQWPEVEEVLRSCTWVKVEVLRSCTCTCKSRIPECRNTLLQ